MPDRARAAAGSALRSTAALHVRSGASSSVCGSPTSRAGRHARSRASDSRGLVTDELDAHDRPCGSSSSSTPPVLPLVRGLRWDRHVLDRPPPRRTCVPQIGVGHFARSFGARCAVAVPASVTPTCRPHALQSPSPKCMSFPRCGVCGPQRCAFDVTFTAGCDEPAHLRSFHAPPISLPLP